MPRVTPGSISNRRRELIFLAVSGLFTVAYFASIQFLVSEPIDFDVYYHLAMARELLHRGPLKSFPWAPYSILADHFADKEFLFHAVLMAVNGLEVTQKAQWGALIGQAFLVGSFGFALWRLKVPQSWLFPVLITALGSAIAIRLSMCRPHTWGVGFSVIVITLIITRSRVRWIVLAAFLYSLFHTGAWITAFYAGVWAFWSFVIRDPDAEAGGKRRIEWKPLAAVVGGWALGQTLNPSFPDTFRLMIIQNFWVPYYATAAGNAALKVALGAELSVVGFRTVAENWPTFILLLVMVAMLAGRRGTRTVEALTAFTIALAFTVVCTLFIKRLYEMAAPFSALAMAVVWRNWFAQGGSDEAQPATPSRRLLIAVCVLILASTAWSFRNARANAPETSAPMRMARWMARNVIEPQPVFTAQWADSAALFYFAPHLTSLVALDPTFFYAKDRDLFIRYVEIVLGKTRNPVGEILDRFGAKYVTVWKIPAFIALDRQLVQDPRALMVYEDRTYRVWKIGRDAVRTIQK